MAYQTKCYYHENRDAVAHCESCGRLVCTECKMIYRLYHPGGKHRRGYTERFEYCPVCKYRREETPHTGSTICNILFLVIFIGMFLSFGVMSIGPGFGLIFLAIPGLILIQTLYRALIVSPKRRAEATQKKGEFMASVGLDAEYNKTTSLHPPSNRETPAPPSVSYLDALVDKKSFYCAQCGTLLQRGAKFCPSCGDSTEDEMAMMNTSPNGTQNAQ